MRPGLRRRGAILAATLSLASAFGCIPSTSAPIGGVYAEYADSYQFGSGVYFVKINVVVSGSQPFQAYDLELQWNPDVVKLVDTGSVALPRPHPDFDDNGALFAPVDLDQPSGLLRNLVDLRHGGAGVSGTVRVASAWFYARRGGQAVIQVSGTVASPAGERFSLLAGSPFVFPTQP